MAQFRLLKAPPATNTRQISRRTAQNGLIFPIPFFFFFLLEEISTRSSAFCAELDVALAAGGFPFASSLFCCGGGRAVGSAATSGFAVLGSAATLGTSSPATGAS